MYHHSFYVLPFISYLDGYKCCYYNADKHRNVRIHSINYDTYRHNNNNTKERNYRFIQMRRSDNLRKIEVIAVDLLDSISIALQLLVGVFFVIVHLKLSFL